MANRYSEIAMRVVVLWSQPSLRDIAKITINITRTYKRICLFHLPSKIYKPGERHLLLHELKYERTRA